LVLSLNIQPPSLANAQSDFFKGKQITIVVGFTGGGIIDLWARLFTQYFGKYTAVVQSPETIERLKKILGG
jgi:tripartite-type tricarboxylate transporter receptor subunit TctC